MNDRDRQPKTQDEFFSKGKDRRYFDKYFPVALKNKWVIDTRKTPVESFILEYFDLCRRHGMRLEGTEYTAPEIRQDEVDNDYIGEVQGNIPWAERWYWADYISTHFLCHIGILHPIWRTELKGPYARPVLELKFFTVEEY